MSLRGHVHESALELGGDRSGGPDVVHENVGQPVSHGALGVEQHGVAVAPEVEEVTGGEGVGRVVLGDAGFVLEDDGLDATSRGTHASQEANGALKESSCRFPPDGMGTATLATMQGSGTNNRSVSG